MRKIIFFLIIYWGLVSIVFAHDASLNGKYTGTGRACSGALFLRTKTVEWNSPFSVCKSTDYDVLEQDEKEGQERIALQFKKISKRCLYKIVEIEKSNGYNWKVRGYQSVESFHNRKLPDWINSPAPERQVLACTMVK